jgi:3-oxoadipate enol-lactonase
MLAENLGMTDLTIAGETFNVLIEGDETNPVLVLSHSLGATLNMWDAQIPGLVKHFRVVRYDSRGHGGSVAGEGPYSIQQLGRDALAILDALGIEKAHWLGLSKGGAVGQWLMINAPERIERAVLANTAAQFGTPEEWNSRILTVKHGGMEATADWLLGRWFSDDFLETQDALVEPIRQDLLATPPEGYAAACAALRDLDLREGLRQIEHPVLVIAGKDDPAAAKPQTDLLAATIPNAKLVTLNTRHISNVEDPTGFTKAVVDFLTAKAPARQAAIRKAALPLPAARRPAGRRLTAARGVVSESLARRPAAKTSPAGKAKEAPAKSAAKPEKKSTAKPAARKPVAVKAPGPKAQASKTQVTKAQATKAKVTKAKVTKAKAAGPKVAAKKAPAPKAQAPAPKAEVTKTKASRAAAVKPAKNPAKKVAAKPAVTAKTAKKAPVKGKVAKIVAKPVAAKKPVKTPAKPAAVKTSRKPAAKAKTPVPKAKTTKTAKAPGRPAGRRK